MEFKIKTINESIFQQTLDEIVEENNTYGPSDITFNRDSIFSNIILSKIFIDRLLKINPEALDRLKKIH